MTRNNGYYAVQGHSRSPLSTPYTTSYYWIPLTYILSCIVCKISQSIGQIFAVCRGASL